MDPRKSLGEMGEKKAAAYLERKGYTIIEQNYKCKIGELDIIAMDRETLVAIEVKTRRSLSHGLPCEAITNTKKRHIVRTLNYYILSNNLSRFNLRVDCIEILSTDNGNYINHIENAF